ncbi:serine/threonine-protein kinase [Streptomyces tropicalis]|uniref:Protein kinase n=1 Tax=Streptomyces tropicalis TaxID=3034234 RepID=A0ABT6A7X6_9ACTN|nr:protein kinase [Streptomyces tropicalis]MDF3300745.1 protein kinase [Streptomyces tropicalis]
MQKLGAGDPQRIGAYRLLARLGAGGMGQVYLARSDRGRTVAVKLVRQELAEQEEFRARFRQEVQAARRVGGHWTAPVLDADTEAAVPWVATGYVAGPSLQQVVGHDHGALPERSVRILAAGLASALKDIHAAGLIHRDLKPSNVLVTIDGPRVIDFGIARALETVTDGGLTRTGALVGSPGFMAPEQVRGDRVTTACDVFCLGSVLAYATTGSLPFGGADSGVHALMYRIAEEEPDLDGVPEGIADLVRACLRKDPAGRPALDEILARTGAEDTVAEGHFRDPWLPSALVAQLGRGAVQLLDAETPEDAAEAAGAQVAADVRGAGKDGPAPGPAPSAAAPTPRPPGAPGGAQPPVNHLPTMVAGQSPPPGPAPAYPAYGYPHQHPGPAAYGHPPAGSPSAGTPAAHPYGGLGATPPYGPPPAGSTPPYGPAPFPAQTPGRGSGRSTALLVAVALVVALGAGGSVYALMRGGGSDDGKGAGGVTTADGAPATPGSTAPGTTPADGQPDPPPAAEGAVPAGYLGTWTASITNAFGENPRRLTLTQGRVGAAVLTLVADGPTDGGGSYHCVFEARLTQQPDTGGPLEIGPSAVTSGHPMSACTPGAATEVTLLPDGTLRRVNTDTGESLTYTRQ